MDFEDFNKSLGWRYYVRWKLFDWSRRLGAIKWRKPAMPLVEPHEFRLDHGVIITCAQPIDSEKLVEILNGLLKEITEGNDNPEAENSVTERTPFTKG